MSDPGKTKRTDTPLVQPASEVSSVVRDGTATFVRELFANGVHFEECFRKICESGCPQDEFAQLLWAACFHITFQDVPLLNAGKLTKAQLRGLPKRMRSLAEIISALNKTPLAPANEMKIMPDAPKGSKAQAVRDYVTLRYNMLPGMLNVYAYHLERFTRIARKSLKRLTTAQLYAIGVVHCVKKHTGRPRYEDVAELLQQGCLVVGDGESVPKFLTAESLAKLYQRWGDGLR